MGEVIGELLPLAVGVAISPVPIIAVILMLLAPRAQAASVAFLAGWLLGLTVVVVLAVLLIGPASGDDGDGPSTVVSVVKLVLGVAAVLLAVRQWRSRPRPGETAELPRWMAAVDQVTPGRAVGLGLALSAVNPKNLTLCLAAGVAIGGAAVSTGQTVVAAAVFVVLGASTVAAPVLAYLVARSRMGRPLEELRDWLTTNNATVMAVLLLVLGVNLVGKGLAGLF